MQVHIPRYAIGLDLETLDTRPTALVTQIGLVLSDLSTGVILEELEILPLLDRRNQPRATVDANTIQWWFGQDQDLFKHVLFGGTRLGIDHVKTEVRRFFALAKDQTYSGDIAFWAGPADFDFPILYNMVGEQVWDHNMVKCFRTLRKALDKDRKHAPENSKAHDAMSDAAWMLGYLYNLRKLAYPEVPVE